MRRKPPPLLGIFLTVFLDLLSFGLVIPDIQIRGDHLGADGFVRGLLLASFSIAQLVTAPLLGRLSDRIGRRPILLVTAMLSTVSFLVYAHADSLWIMFVARIFSGMAGASLGVAYAYIADVTTVADRAKGMGMVGAAFGLGFIFGPPFGAFLIKAGNGTPLIMGYVAAGLSLVNFLYILAVLPESLRKEVEQKATRASNFQNLKLALGTPTLGLLLALFFVANFAFANLETTFFLLDIKHFGMDEQAGAIVLTVVGIVSAFMQGYLVRVLTPKFGEVRLLRLAYLIQAPALLFVPFAPPWVLQLVGTILLGIGTGLAQPCLGSLISKNAPKEMQGGIFGVTQMLGACARILAPIVSNRLFDFRYFAPYVLASVIMVVPMIGMWRIKISAGEHDSPPAPEFA